MGYGLGVFPRRYGCSGIWVQWDMGERCVSQDKITTATAYVEPELSCGTAASSDMWGLERCHCEGWR